MGINKKGTREQYFTSLRFFRTKMCSSEYTVEQKDNYYQNLCEDYIKCDITKDDRMHFVAVTEEWERRRVYERLKELEKEV